MSVRPAKIEISLGIRPVWSDSVCAQWVAKDLSFLHGTAKTDQTGWMPRLIWIFAGHTATLLVLSCCGSVLSCCGSIFTYLAIITLQTMTDVSGNPEDERHCEFYDQPWSHEAVCRYFYGKVRNQKKHQGWVKKTLEFYELPADKESTVHVLFSFHSSGSMVCITFALPFLTVRHFLSWTISAPYIFSFSLFFLFVGLLPISQNITGV